MNEITKTLKQGMLSFLGIKPKVFDDDTGIETETLPTYKSKEAMAKSNCSFNLASGEATRGEISFDNTRFIGFYRTCDDLPTAYLCNNGDRAWVDDDIFVCVNGKWRCFGSVALWRNGDEKKNVR